MATKNPYIDLIKSINQKAQAQEQKEDTNAEGLKQNAYIGYMNNKRDLNDVLAAQGIAGGGSESASLGANVGYQRQNNLIDASRASNVADIRQNAMANETSAKMQSADWENQQQQLEEQRFANTITGYDSIAACDNAIEAATASGDMWKIPYLKAQRAALKEQAAAKAAAYSYSSGSSGSGSSGGSSGSTVKTTTPNTQNGYYSNNNGSYYNNKTGSYGITGGGGGHYSY